MEITRDENHVYKRGDDTLPSVTTILREREDDKSNLYNWQDRNHGDGDTASHEHLFWYSRHVGTLGHWYALSELDPDLAWTEDEAQSLDELTRQDEKEVRGDSPREILYSILRGDANKGGGSVSSWGEFYDKYHPYRTNEYYNNAILDVAERDVAFFRNAQQRLWSKVGIEEVLTVEQYLFNDADGYAGQVDLVYEDEDGHVVVADLKSSSGCYDKHQIQGAAYGRAIEHSPDVDVDDVARLEVHRAHPRTGQMAIHTHRDAPGKTPVHTTKYWNDSYQSLWEQFEPLLDKI